MKPQGLYHNYQNEMFLLIAFGAFFFPPSSSEIP